MSAVKYSEELLGRVACEVSRKGPYDCGGGRLMRSWGVEK